MNRMLRSTPLAERFGAVVEAPPGGTLSAVNAGWLEKLLAEHGVVLLRGFGGGSRGMAALADRFGPPINAHISPELVRQVENGERTYRESLADDRFTQTVTGGACGINPHSEAYYSPFCPDLLWFYCIRPARHRGRTGVCDGRRVLADLPDDIRRQFLEAELRNHSRFPRRAMERILGIGDLEAAFRRLPEARRQRLTWSVDPAEVEFDYRAPQIRRCRYSGELAFANNSLGGDGATLEDYERTGDPFGPPTPFITPEMGAAAKAAVRCYLVWIDWRPGDVAAIDNTRVMHAREPFTDDGRRAIVVRMTGPVGRPATGGME